MIIRLLAALAMFAALYAALPVNPCRHLTGLDALTCEAADIHVSAVKLGAAR